MFFGGRVLNSTPDYFVLDGKKMVPAQANYKKRMDQIADFKSKAFVDAFQATFGKK